MSDLAALLLALGFIGGFIVALWMAMRTLDSLVGLMREEFPELRADLRAALEARADAIRYAAEVSRGHHEPEIPEEVPPEDHSEDMHPIDLFLEEKRFDADLAADVRGMYASLLGLRGKVAPAQRHEFTERLSRLGAPLPGMSIT